MNAETGEVTLTTKPRRRTYKQQNWRAYEAAQMTERARVPQLLHSLCESCVDEPEGVPGKPGRKPIPRREAIYAAVMKVYSCCSGRRADPDIKAGVDRGHLSRKWNPKTVGLDYKALCRTCGKRVSITVRGKYAHHKAQTARTMWLVAERCDNALYNGWHIYLRDTSNHQRNADGYWGWIRRDHRLALSIHDD